MADTSRIREHMEVVGSDGQHVGTVDHVIPDKEIKLTRTDPASDGHHHFIPIGIVDSVDDRVHLDRPANQVSRTWRTQGIDEGMR